MSPRAVAGSAGLLCFLLALPALAEGESGEGADSEGGGETEADDASQEEAEAEAEAALQAKIDAAVDAAVQKAVAEALAAQAAAAEAEGGAEAGDAEAEPKKKLRISDFIRTTLTFYLGDDNVLAGNEDGSPAFGFNEYPELFFEGLDSEKLAAVSETHLVLQAKAPGLIPFVDTEAAFVAEFELSKDPDDGRLIGRFADDGSWIGVKFWFDRAKQGSHLELTFWPYDADRFRLGYLYDLGWGGDRIWARNRGPVPGMRARLNTPRFYAYVGAKSLTRLRADNNQNENYWGFLGGLGPNIEFGPESKARFAYDLGGGYFTRGTYQQDPFRSQALRAFGLSHRVQFTWNDRIGASSDLRLMRNDPEGRAEPSIVPDYKGSFGFGVSLEVSTLWQSLINADAPDTEVFDDAITGALSAQVRFLKSMRVGATVVYRDVSFLVFNVPGLTPYLSFAEGTIQRPQVYGAIGWDWYIEKAHLQPGFVFGLMQPASFESVEVAGERQVEIIREANDYEILPAGTTPFTILALKGSLTWVLSDAVAIRGEVSFQNDYNVSKTVTNPETGVGERVLDEALAQALGLNLFVQARF